MILILFLLIFCWIELKLGQQCTYTPRMVCEDGSWDISNTGKFDGTTMCYKAIFWGSKTVSFNEARKMCQTQFGADMAPVRNDEEYNTMKAAFNRVWKGTRHGQMYIGARDLSNTRSSDYHWVHDGSRVTYLRWNKNQPSQRPGAQHGLDYEKCLATMLNIHVPGARPFDFNDTFCEGFKDAINGVVCAKKAKLLWD